MTSHETYQLGRALLVGGIIVWRFWRTVKATRRRASPAPNPPARPTLARTKPIPDTGWQQAKDEPLQSRDPFNDTL